MGKKIEEFKRFPKNIIKKIVWKLYLKQMKTMEKIDKVITKFQNLITKIKIKLIYRINYKIQLVYLN
jgi:hypothetical protein